MSRVARGAAWVLLGIFVVVNVAYWQDPWLWRRYVFQLAGLEPDESQGRRPQETVTGGNGWQLPVATGADRTIDTAAIEAAVTYAKKWNSFALIAIHRGVVQLEWFADGYDRYRMTESMSMHKTLVGLLTGAAIADGVIGSVEDPVGRYIDEWRDDPRGSIALKHLLQMSSGLAQYHFDRNPFSDHFRWLQSGYSTRAILNVPLADWDPGSRFEYNNLASELLGLTLERAYGMRYSRILEQKLWRPLGADRARVWVDREGGTAHTSCCLTAPAMDWAKVGVMMLNGGRANGSRVIPEAWIDEMTTASPASPFYGYQVWLGTAERALPGGGGSTGPVGDTPFTDPDTFRIVGRGQQHVWVMPSLELVVVRMGPAFGPAPINPGFDVARIPNLLAAGLIEQRPATSAP